MTIETNKHSTNAFSFTKTQRSDPILSPNTKGDNKDRILNPGPGRYNVDYNKNKPKMPSYTFSHQKLDSTTVINHNNTSVIVSNKHNTINPGPGAYYNEEIYNRISSPSYTINKSKKDFNNINSKEINSNVGPGRYNLENKFNNKASTTAYKIGTSPKNKNITNNNPGPGAYNSNYNVVKAKETTYTIPNSKRSNFFNKTDNPGPGRYNLNNGTNFNSFKGNKGFSFGNEKKQTKIEDKPGPGQYNVDVSITKGSTNNVIFNNSKQRALYDNLKSDTPGPGRYGTMYNFKSSSSGVVFNKDKKDKNKISDIPGPGQYNLPGSIRDFSDVLVK